MALTLWGSGGACLCRSNSAAGDLVPADGRLLEARDFFVNEALLTGESYPAEKRARDEGVDSPDFAEAANAVFMGSSVMNGSARLMVCGTGLATQLGQISSSLDRRSEEHTSELQSLTNLVCRL